MVRALVLYRRMRTTLHTLMSGIMNMGIVSNIRRYNELVENLRIVRLPVYVWLNGGKMKTGNAADRRNADNRLSDQCHNPG